jgi:hypothetical protein
MNPRRGVRVPLTGAAGAIGRVGVQASNYFCGGHLVAWVTRSSGRTLGCSTGRVDVDSGSWMVSPGVLVGPTERAAGHGKAWRTGAQDAQFRLCMRSWTVPRVNGERLRSDQPRDGRPTAGCRGMTNTAIAERLVLSPRTVETHVANLVAKTNVAGRSGLTRLANSGSAAD